MAIYSILILLLLSPFVNTTKITNNGKSFNLIKPLDQLRADTFYVRIDSKDSLHYKVVGNPVIKDDEIRNFLVFADEKFQWRNFIFVSKTTPFRRENSIDKIHFITPDEIASMFSKRDYGLFRTETFVIIHEKEGKFLFSAVKGFHNGPRLQNDFDEEPRTRNDKK